MNSVGPEGEDREKRCEGFASEKIVRTILPLHKALIEALLRQMASQDDKQQMVQVEKEGSRRRKASKVLPL